MRIKLILFMMTPGQGMIEKISGFGTNKINEQSTTFLIILGDF